MATVNSLLFLLSTLAPNVQFPENYPVTETTPSEWATDESNGIFPTRCIDDLGCFNSGPPFYNPIHRPVSLLPQRHVKTHFIVYTHKSEDPTQILLPTNESLAASSINPTVETRILIHGFLQGLPHHDVFFAIKDELMENSPMNVIIVDWTRNNHPPYEQAVANTRVVGAQVAKLINYHVENMKMDPKSFHIIGHSLGAHVAGYAGERVPGLGRITGLDPAGPAFQKAPPIVRLDTTDAEFVDIIHTNAGHNVAEGYGLDQIIGHIDFYPNGGKDQPGCLLAATAMTAGERGKLTRRAASVCSHNRANYIFKETINMIHFVGVECRNYRDFRKGKCRPDTSNAAIMGFPATKPSEEMQGAKYYLQTRRYLEYC